MDYSLSVVVPAIHFSSAGVTEVVVPVRGLLITRVEVQRVFLAASFARFGSRSCLLLLHVHVTSCEACSVHPSEVSPAGLCWAIHMGYWKREADTTTRCGVTRPAQSIFL